MYNIVFFSAVCIYILTVYVIFYTVPTVQSNGLEPSIPTVNYTVIFPVSDLPQSQTFTLTPVDDTVPNEPNEVIQLVFASISDMRVAQDDPADIVIIDNDHGVG